MEREEASRSLRGIHVLLVDEEPQHRNLLRDVLRYCGAWVREVAGIDEALGVLRETTPDVLVVVVRLTGEVAWRLVRTVRALRPEHGGKMPVVGIGAPGLTGPAREQGLDAYLPEPIEALALCRVVAELTE
jgi:CheY-like chemotaxis protein